MTIENLMPLLYATGVVAVIVLLAVGLLLSMEGL